MVRNCWWSSYLVPPTVLIGRLRVLFALIEWYSPVLPGRPPLAVGVFGVIIIAEAEGVIIPEPFGRPCLAGVGPS